MRLDYNVLSYFNYDIEKVLDEFNNYYNIKSNKIPIIYQTIFLYFSHHSENALQILIKSQYNFKNAREIELLPLIHLRKFKDYEIIQIINQHQFNPIHFYGLITFSYYFYEYFLDYIKYNNETSLLNLFQFIPNIEYNLELIKEVIKRFPSSYGNHL